MTAIKRIVWLLQNDDMKEELQKVRADKKL
jgi:hypothetical protein